MFVYFSPDQVLTRDFRGPDVFVAKDGTKRSRKKLGGVAGGRQGAGCRDRADLR
ncbi:MAG: hypothetical protein U0531_20400 [Dehalococcoidia bacterium]